MAPADLDPMDATVEMLGEDEIAMRESAAKIGSAKATKAHLVVNRLLLGKS